MNHFAPESKKMLSRNADLLRERPFAELSLAQINKLRQDLEKEHTRIMVDPELSEKQRFQELQKIMDRTYYVEYELLERCGPAARDNDEIDLVFDEPYYEE